MAGAVYLSGPVACMFTSYNENAQRIFINSNNCTGNFTNLTVHLDCLKQPTRLVSAGNLTTDAHLAALAIEHQCELHSNDTDFARFPGLRWRNPL